MLELPEQRKSGWNKEEEKHKSEKGVGAKEVDSSRKRGTGANMRFTERKGPGEVAERVRGPDMQPTCRPSQNSTAPLINIIAQNQQQASKQT